MKIEGDLVDVEAKDLAEMLDVADVAAEVDHYELAQQMDVEAVAKHIDKEEVADELARTAGVVEKRIRALEAHGEILTKTMDRITRLEVYLANLRSAFLSRGATPVA